MGFWDGPMADRLMGERKKDKLVAAQQYRLLRQAQTGRRMRSPGRLSRLVHRLGHVLIAVGRRLKQYPLPQATASDGPVVSQTFAR